MASLLLASVVAPSVAFAKTRTSLAATLNKTSCTYASPATLSGTLKTSTGRAIPSASVALYRGSTRIGTYKTNKYGKVSLRVKYPGTASWRLRYAGSSAYYSSNSPYRTTKAIILATARTQAGKSQSLNIRKNVSLVAGRAYQWSVNALAPTVKISGAGKTPVNVIRGRQRVEDGTGTTVTYLWWTESRVFKPTRTSAAYLCTVNSIKSTRSASFLLW